MVQQIIVLHDYAWLVVDVERQVHVRQVFDELFQHDGCGFSVPCVHIASSFNLGDLSVANHDRDQSVVEADGFSRSLADDCRFQRPEGEELVVYGVILVYEFNPSLFGEIVPFVKVRRRR